MQCGTIATGFDADETHGIVAERMEDANRIRAATDAGHDGIGQAAGALEHLCPRLFADHRLETPHEVRIGVGSSGCADHVMGRLDVGDPVANGIVEGVFECARTVRDGDHFSAKEPHPHDVWTLSPHVLLAHVDDGLEAEARTDGCSRDAVLARAGLGDDALLAKALGDQGLAECIIDRCRRRWRDRRLGRN